MPRQWIDYVIDSPKKSNSSAKIRSPKKNYKKLEKSKNERKAEEKKTLEQYGIPFFSRMIQVEKEELSFFRQFEKKLNVIENLTRANNSNKNTVNLLKNEKKNDKSRMGFLKLTNPQKIDDRHLVNRIYKKINTIRNKCINSRNYDFHHSNQQPIITKNGLIVQKSLAYSSPGFILTSLGEEIQQEDNQIFEKKDCHNETSLTKERVPLKIHPTIETTNENNGKSVRFLLDNERLTGEYSTNNGDDKFFKEDSLKSKRKFLMKKGKFTLQYLVDSNDKFAEALKIAAVAD